MTIIRILSVTILAKLGRFSRYNLFSYDYSRVFIYSLSVVFDSASYIKTFGLTEADLSQSIIYKVAIFAVLVAIASGGESYYLKFPARWWW